MSTKLISDPSTVDIETRNQFYSWVYTKISIGMEWVRISMIIINFVVLMPIPVHTNSTPKFLIFFKIKFFTFGIPSITSPSIGTFGFLFLIKLSNIVQDIDQSFAQFQKHISKIQNNEINSGSVSIGDRSLNSGQSKRAIRHVQFDVPFSGIPKVSLGFKLLDTTAPGTVTRIYCEAHNITTKGMDISFQTWSDSLVFDAIVDYIAYYTVLHDEIQEKQKLQQQQKDLISSLTGIPVDFKSSTRKLFMRTDGDNHIINTQTYSSKWEKYIIEGSSKYYGRYTIRSNWFPVFFFYNKQTNKLETKDLNKQKEYLELECSTFKFSPYDDKSNMDYFTIETCSNDFLIKINNKNQVVVEKKENTNYGYGFIINKR
ncbi:hypothetical protein ACTA71_004584 [Dictyostelium dimigraforme]